jgi:hypothetical protein
VAKVALIFVPFERLAELFSTLLLADMVDDVAAAPLALACAPELLDCIEDWDCAEAPACPEAVVCAAVMHAPNVPMASNESNRFI